MVFNDTSTKQGIIQDITFLTGVDTNKYPIADRVRSANEWNNTVWSWIFESCGGWTLDPATSVATLPAGLINALSGTAVYPLPTDSLSVNRVEILLEDGVTWQKLIPITLEEIKGPEGEFCKNSGVPIYYRLLGQIVQLYPTPNYSGTNYIKVFFDRGMTAFTASSTTETPGFASAYHRIVSIGASLDYADANVITTKINSLSNRANNFEKRIKQFYIKRFKEKFPTHMRVNDSVRQYS